MIEVHVCVEHGGLRLDLCVMQASKCPEGTKPMLLFAGEAFDTDNEHKRLKSLLIGWYFVQTEPDVLFHTNEADQRQTFLSPSDFFRGPNVSAVRLAGLEHVLHFTSLDGKIYMRSYR